MDFGCDRSGISFYYFWKHWWLATHCNNDNNICRWIDCWVILVHLFLKIAIIAAIILFVVAYFGFFGLSLGFLKNYATQYGSIVYQYGALIIGILPLSIGFVIGIIIGFVLSKPNIPFI